MPLLDELNDELQTERGAAIAPSDVEDAIGLRLQALKCAAWGWYRAHRDDAVISILGIKIITYGNGKIRAVFERIFGPAADCGIRL